MVADMVPPRPRAKASDMDVKTFVLVVQAFTGVPAPQEIREPGMTLPLPGESVQVAELP